MKVSTYGISIESPLSEISLSDFIKHLESANGNSNTAYEIERRIYVDKSTHHNWWTGLVITIRDQKRFCKMQNSSGKISITVENLAVNSKIMDFNFFVLNKKTGSGVYQHYFQSCSVGRFAAYLQLSFQDLANARASNEIEKAKKLASFDDSDEKKIRSKFSEKLIFERMCSKEALADLLKEYKKISSFEYDIVTIAPRLHSSGAVPLPQISSKIREKFTFKRSVSTQIIAESIISTISQLKPKRGSVRAADAGKTQHTIKIFDMPESFSEEDYDSVVTKLDKLDVDNFAKSIPIKSLINTCESAANKALFC